MKQWVDNIIEDKIHEEVVNIIKPYIKDNARILDLGCHDDWIADKVPYEQLHLVDSDMGELKHRDNPNITYFYMTIFKFFEFAIDLGAKYDVILLLGVIEHLNHIQKTNLLTSIKTLLVDGGIFVLGYPNANSLNRVLGVEMNLIHSTKTLTEGDKKIGHQSMYGSRAVSHFRFYLRLDIEKTEGILYKPLPNSLMLKYFRKDLDKFMAIGKELGWQYCGYIVCIYRNNYES